MLRIRFPLSLTFSSITELDYNLILAPCHWNLFVHFHIFCSEWIQRRISRILSECDYSCRPLPWISFPFSTRKGCDLQCALHRITSSPTRRDVIHEINPICWSLWDEILIQSFRKAEISFQIKWKRPIHKFTIHSVV